jgi:hypothetical protein
MISQSRACPIQVGIDDICRSSDSRSETALSRNRSKLVRVYRGDPPDRPELGLSGRSSRPTSPKYPRLRSIDPTAGLRSLCATSIETRYARVRVGWISIFTRPKTNPACELRPSIGFLGVGDSGVHLSTLHGSFLFCACGLCQSIDASKGILAGSYREDIESVGECCSLCKIPRDSGNL